MFLTHEKKKQIFFRNFVFDIYKGDGDHIYNYSNSKKKCFQTILTWFFKKTEIQ